MRARLLVKVARATPDSYTLLFAADTVTTLHEAGLTGFDTSQWLGLLAPRGTPGEVLSRLHGETARILAVPEVRARLAEAALQAVGNTPREFEGVIRADIERWTKLARSLASSRSKVIQMAFESCSRRCGAGGLGAGLRAGSA